jgi:hypothetical protein
VIERRFVRIIGELTRRELRTGRLPSVSVGEVAAIEPDGTLSVWNGHRVPSRGWRYNPHLAPPVGSPVRLWSTGQNRWVEPISDFSDSDALPRSVMVDVRETYARVDGSHDDTAELHDAVVLVQKEGGGTVVVPGGTLCWSDAVMLPDAVNIVGTGGGGLGYGTRFLKLAAAAELAFGPLGAGSRGGTSGNFRIHGAELGGNGMRLGRCVQRHFFSIDVTGITASGGIAYLLEESQNNTFDSCHDSGNREGWVYDRGASSNTRFNCETNLSTSSIRGHRYSASTVVAGLPDWPTGNTSIGGITERGGPSTTELVLHEAGVDNTYRDHVFSWSDADHALPMVQMTKPTAQDSRDLRISGKGIQGTLAYTTAYKLAASGNSLRLSGYHRVNIHAVGYDVASGATVYHDDTLIEQNLTARFQGAGSEVVAGRRPVYLGTWLGTITAATGTLVLRKSDAASGVNVGLRGVFAGRIVGIALRTTNAGARTAGTATAVPTVGTVAQASPTSVLDGTQTITANAGTNVAGGPTYNGSQVIGINVDTSGYAPTGHEVVADLYGIFDQA